MSKKTNSLIVVWNIERLEDQIYNLLQRKDHNIKILQIVHICNYRSDTIAKLREILPWERCREVIYYDIPPETQVAEEDSEEAIEEDY